jgi:hypothetical protein
MPLIRSRLWTAANGVRLRHPLACFLLYPFSDTICVNIEKTVIAYTPSSYDTNVVVRKVLGVLENLGTSRRRVLVPVVENPTLLQRMDGCNPEPPLECRRGDGDVICCPTGNVIGADKAVWN